MRSIGKRNIKKVQDLTMNLMMTEKLNGQESILKCVRDMLPEEMWDTWEMADSEINRIIYDTISEYTYRRGK
jgi:hypothetical protein